MRYLLMVSALVVFHFHAHADERGGQGVGTSPGGSTPGSTHVSPGGMGGHPSVQSDSTTNRGTTPLGAPTLGQPTSPSSGSTRNRSNDMTGRDMSNATHMGSDTDTSVPTATPERKPIGDETRTSEIRENYKVGPYRDNAYDYRYEGPEGRQAQEAAEDGDLGASESTIEKKQEGR